MKMKNLIFIILLTFSININAQITLEHTYDNASTLYSNLNLYYDQLMIINFEVSGERYVRINRNGKTIDIYAMNHSLQKTINCSSFPLSMGGTPYFGDVLYLSENLFATDSKIEFMYCYQYSDSSTGGYAMFATNIYNEDGLILFSDTGAAAVHLNIPMQQFPIYNTSNGTKMILSYRYGQAKVFSLPGTLSQSIQEANNVLIVGQSSVSNPYPNPTNNTTQIDYIFPPGVNEGEIVFYDLQGMEVKRFKVDKTFSTLLISTSDLAAGTYYYQLQTSLQNSGGKKMVLIK